MAIRIITMLITGTVLTAGLIIGFGGYVFAAENYNSSKSNTATGIINRDVGNLLVDYGYGGEVVNQVTEALARGVTTDGLRAILSGTSARSPAVVEEVLLKLEAELMRLGIREDDTQAISAPDATGAVPSASSGTIKDILPAKQAEPVPACPKHTCTEKEVCVKGICVPSSATGTIKDILPSKRAPSAGDTPQARIFIKLGDLPEKQMAFGDSAMKFIQDLKAAESDDQLKGKVRHELKANRETLQKSAETLRQNLRENAQDLRDNFRTEYLKYELKDVRVVSFRIAVAHGKGLRMINRYRSAIARFDHILGRLESRIEKIGIEAQARATDKGKIKDYFPASVTLLIEEAKNMQVENEAKLEELKAKYESLLLGENAGGIGLEARAIAKELKAATENLHAKLRKIGDDIKLAVYDWYPSKNSSKRIALIQSTIEKIQKRLESCDNTDVCDIVDRHAKGRTEITVTIKKAIENGNWEDAARLLREMRGIVVGDIELLEGVEKTESIAGVLELERSLLNYIDSALVSI